MNVSFDLNCLDQWYELILSKRDSESTSISSTDELKKTISLSKFVFHNTRGVTEIYKDFLSSNYAHSQFPDILFKTKAVKEFKNWEARPASKEKKKLLTNIDNIGDSEDKNYLVSILFLEVLYRVHILEEYVGLDELQFLKGFEFCGHKLFVDLIHYQLIYGKISSLRQEFQFLKGCLKKDDKNTFENRTDFTGKLYNLIGIPTLSSGFAGLPLGTAELSRCEYKIHYFHNKYNEYIELESDYTLDYRNSETSFYFDGTFEPHRNSYINQIGNFEALFVNFMILLAFHKPKKKESLFPFNLFDHPAYLALSEVKYLEFPTSLSDAYFPNLLNSYHGKYARSYSPREKSYTSDLYLSTYPGSIDKVTPQKISNAGFKNKATFEESLLKRILEQNEVRKNLGNNDLRNAFDRTLPNVNPFSIHEDKLPDFLIEEVRKEEISPDALKKFMSNVESDMRSYLSTYSISISNHESHVAQKEPVLKTVAEDALVSLNYDMMANLKDKAKWILTDNLNEFINKYNWSNYSLPKSNSLAIKQSEQELTKFLNDCRDHLSNLIRT